MQAGFHGTVISPIFVSSNKRNDRTMNSNEKYDELKRTMKIDQCVKLANPIRIKVRSFNFNTGCADTINDFDVEFVGKVPYGSVRPEDMLSYQIVEVYGVKHYSSGSSYKHCDKLTYTDDEELQKVIDAVKESGEPKSFDEYWEEIRKY